MVDNRKGAKYKPSDKFCALCVSEKRHILFAYEDKSINKRDEFVSKCRHQNKFKLSFLKNAQEVDLLAHTNNVSLQHKTGVDAYHKCNLSRFRKVKKVVSDWSSNLKECTVRIEKLDLSNQKNLTLSPVVKAETLNLRDKEYKISN